MNLENTILRGASHGIEDKRIRRKVKESLRDLDPDEYPNCVNDFLRATLLTQEIREAVLKAQRIYREEIRIQEYEDDSNYLDKIKLDKIEAEAERRAEEEERREEQAEIDSIIMDVVAEIMEAKKEEAERRKQEEEDYFNYLDAIMEEEEEEARLAEQQEEAMRWLEEENRKKEEEARLMEEEEKWRWEEHVQWEKEEQMRAQQEYEEDEEQCIRMIQEFPMYVSAEDYAINLNGLRKYLDIINGQQALNDDIQHVIQQKYAEILRYRHVERVEKGILDLSLWTLRDLIALTGLKPPASLVQQTLRELIEIQWLETFQYLIDITGIEPSGNYALDTSVLVDLMISQEAGDFFKKALSRFSGNKFYTSYRCMDEAKKVLMRDYDYSGEKACYEIELLIENYEIQIVHRDYKRHISDSEISDAKWHYDFGEEDGHIIQYFGECENVVIIVRDRSFMKACDHLNIDRINWPSFYNRRPR